MVTEQHQDAVKIVKPKSIKRNTTALSLSSVATCCSETSQDDETSTDNESSPCQTDFEAACSSIDSNSFISTPCPTASMEGGATAADKMMGVGNSELEPRALRRIPRFHDFGELLDLNSLSENEIELLPGTVGIGMRRSQRHFNLMDL